MRVQAYRRRVDGTPPDSRTLVSSTNTIQLYPAWLRARQSNLKFTGHSSFPGDLEWPGSRDSCQLDRAVFGMAGSRRFSIWQESRVLRGQGQSKIRFR